jgi:type I restriction enzyme S subunit
LKNLLPSNSKVLAMNFESKRLGDVAEIVGGGTPSTKDAINWDGGIPWLTPKDLSSFEGIYVDRGSRSITEKGLKSSSAKMLPAGAVLYTSRAPIGYVAIANNSISTNQGFKSLILKDGYVPEFVFYLLKASKSEIESHASGGTFAEISAKALSNVVLQFPPKVQQEAIAKILLSLDEKIAANNALSKTLEDIAQIIFKSWFIDFDPVKAKMVGEKPAGMDAATAALFPDSMEHSELGLIPKGWKVHSLDEISEYLNGLAMQRFPVIDESEQLPVIKIAQLRAGNTQGADMASGLLDSRFIINDGDILFSWSGTLEVETWAGGPGALNQHLFKVTGKNVPDWYSYLSTKSFLSFFREIASGKATTMGHIQRGHLSESMLAIPDLELLNRATEIIEPLISLKIKTSIESRNLAEIRDSLLPRLISGELQIPEEMLAS